MAAVPQKISAAPASMWNKEKKKWGATARTQRKRRFPKQRKGIGPHIAAIVGG